MKPAANHPHEGKTRTRVGPASLLLLLLAALAPALVEASLPRAGASLLEHEEVAASRLDSSRQAAPFRSPAIAPVAPATIGNGFTLFAGDELARASRAPGAPALAPDHAGDLALASREREERFALDQGADAFGLEPLRGPPPLSEDLCQGDDECLAGTRIGGLELEGPFFTEGRPRLSLELQWACSVSSCELADGKPLDPWGLAVLTDEGRAQRTQLVADIESYQRAGVDDVVSISSPYSYRVRGVRALDRFYHARPDVADLRYGFGTREVVAGGDAATLEKLKGRLESFDFAWKAANFEQGDNLYFTEGGRFGVFQEAQWENAYGNTAGVTAVTGVVASLAGAVAAKRNIQALDSQALFGNIPVAASSPTAGAMYEDPVRYANERSVELQSRLPEASRGRVTMSAGVVETSPGVRRTLVGTSERAGYLRPGVKAGIKPGEIVVGGLRHAESDLVRYAKSKGWKVIAVGAGRPHCVGCASEIEDASAVTASPRRNARK